MRVVPCQRAPDLALLASLRRWATAASFAPLDIHEYVFGGESCGAGLICVRLLVVPRQIGRACHLWRCSSLRSASRSRSHSPRRLSRRLRGPASAALRRGIPLLAPHPAAFAQSPNRAVASHSARRSSSLCAPQQVFSLPCAFVRRPSSSVPAPRPFTPSPFHLFTPHYPRQHKAGNPPAADGDIRPSGRTLLRRGAESSGAENFALVRRRQVSEANA